MFCTYTTPSAGRATFDPGPQPAFVDFVPGLVTSILPTPPVTFNVIVVGPVYRQPAPPNAPSASFRIDVLAGGNASNDPLAGSPVRLKFGWFEQLDGLSKTPRPPNCVLCDTLFAVGEL